METNTTTISLDLMTVAEAAQHVGVSVRTIERHVLLTNCPSEWTIRNKRKVKAYPKHWLDKHFVKNETVGAQNSDRPSNKPHRHDIGRNQTSEKSVRIELNEVINGLREDNTFLRKTVDALIKSDEQTKTLLADLQFQNKNLLLNSTQTKPKAEPEKPEKKESRVWLWLGIGLSAAILTGGYFCYEYIVSLLTH